MTEPIALRRLADLEGNLSLKVYETQTKGFHLKSYVFVNGSEGVAFVGSSNLSEPALTTSIEWNYKVVQVTTLMASTKSATASRLYSITQRLCPQAKTGLSAMSGAE